MTIRNTRTLKWQVVCTICGVVGYRNKKSYSEETDVRMIRTLPDGTLVGPGERLGCDMTKRGYHYLKHKENPAYCETCEGTGEVNVPGRVYANEPHMADVDTAPCPDCRKRNDD